jgi:hypothetical protein
MTRMFIASVFRHVNYFGDVRATASAAIKDMIEALPSCYLYDNDYDTIDVSLHEVMADGRARWTVLTLNPEAASWDELLPEWTKEVRATTIEFTLPNLLRVLDDAGFRVVESGDDLHPEMAAMMRLLDLPHVPCFFARVEDEGDHLLAFSCKLWQVVWAAFGRGAMEFSGDRKDDGTLRVVVSEKETKTS